MVQNDKVYAEILDFLERPYICENIHRDIGDDIIHTNISSNFTAFFPCLSSAKTST